MLPTLVEQYRRWFEYEKDSHRKVLDSLETVPAENRGSEPFQKAMRLMGHIVAAPDVAVSIWRLDNAARQAVSRRSHPRAACGRGQRHGAWLVRLPSAVGRG